jgi:hypothetical protein
MLKLIGWIVGVALFCWATVSAFSIFSELKFLVDGWAWSVDQVPISIKAVALAVGKYVSGVVGGYREFVHGLVAMLHLPKLPQSVYDAAGVATFSIGRGMGVVRREAEADRQYVISLVGKQKADRYLELIDDRKFWNLAKEQREQTLRSAQISPEEVDEINQSEPPPLSLALIERLFGERYAGSYAFYMVFAVVLYGGLIALIIATLFAIDFLYRHFA